MADQTVKKIDADHSPTGAMGQKYLVSGVRMDMRLWDRPPGEADAMHARPYETLGYVISGKVELRLGDDTLTLRAGDSYLVPEGARHSYRVVEHLRAVECCSPPAGVHGRDE